MTREAKIVVGVVGAVLVAGGLVGGGLWAWQWYARSQDPGAARWLHVVAPAPGMPVGDVDSAVCAPIADALGPLAEEAETWSEARAGGCTVHARIDPVRAEGSSAEVERALAALDLPEPPLVSRSGGRTIDLFVALEGASLRQQTAIADGLGRRVERVAGVASVEVCGVSPVLEVRFDEGRARAFGVSIEDVERALASHAGEMPVGSLEVGHAERITAGPDGSEPVEHARVGLATLRDVATIGTIQRPTTCSLFRDGERVVALRVTSDRQRAPEASSEIRRLASGQVLEQATAVFRVSSVSGDPEMAADISRSLGAGSVVQHRTGQTELAIATPPDSAEQVSHALASRPGIALVAAPHPLARLWLRAADRDALEPVAERVLTAIGHTTLHAAPLAGPSRPTVDVRVDRARAAALGVTEADVARALRFVTGVEVARHVDDRGETPVVLRIDGADRSDGESLRHLPVGRASIGHVATLEMTREPTALHRRGRDPALGILVSTASPPRGDPRETIARTLAGVELPEGVTVELEPL